MSTRYNIGTRVLTRDGLGTIKAIEAIGGPRRYGVLHDTFPAHKPRMYPNDILYYLRRDLKPEHGTDERQDDETEA